MIKGWKPWAEKPGDPHLHRCGCGHEYVAHGITASRLHVHLARMRMDTAIWIGRR